MPDRLVLFGGSFDPVHRGHCVIALSIAERCGFARVDFVPAFQAPHKSVAQASAGDRLAMLRLATASESRLGVCDIEFHRAGPSYTIDTLEQLAAGHPGAELFWIIGADMLGDLPSWHRAGDVLAAATIVTAVRAPWNDRLESLLENLRAAFGRDRSEQVRRWVVETPLVDISSTQVRQAVSAGESTDALVAPAVGEYIRAHGLYRSD